MKPIIHEFEYMDYFVCHTTTRERFTLVSRYNMIVHVTILCNDCNDNCEI